MVMSSLDKKPINQGLVLYHPGYEGSGAVIHDNSQYHNNGSFRGVGEPAWEQLASGIWVLDFDGSNDSVNCGNAASLQISIGTSMCWVKTTYGAAVYKGLMSKAFAYAFGIKDGKLACYNWGAGAGWRYNGVTNIADGTWHLCGVTNDGSQGQFFLDAAAEGDPFSFAVLNQGTALAIGSGTPTGEYVDADIGRPRVFNRVLSALDWLNLMNQEKSLFGV